MNRLIIIGNGFDLAHGLPTSYKDFIDDYWGNLELQNHKDNFIHINSDIEYNQKTIKDFSDFKILVEDFIKGKYPNGTISSTTDIKVHISNDLPWESYLEFKNYFFELINQRRIIENWVDIENTYYSSLKQIIKYEAISVNAETKMKDVKILNNEFDDIKNLLEKYLSRRILDVFNFNEYSDSKGDIFEFSNLFKTITFDDDKNDMETFLEEFPKQYQNDIRTQFVYRGDDLISDCKVTFLNFNYTPTLLRYSNVLSQWKIPNEIINIHGSLDDSKNKINFGFGDEMDNDYKLIENINDNEYLKNFKSFQYLYTSNYKRLLDLIDSDIYQVYIMGHSCGLSDRTLLNTVFEHENCVSIKPFYYQIKNELGEVTGDNYTEITQNISRHFNDKKLMREKIVNKTLCRALPQIELPKK